VICGLFRVGDSKKYFAGDGLSSTRLQLLPLTSNPTSTSSFNNTTLIIYVISSPSSTTQHNVSYICRSPAMQSPKFIDLRSPPPFLDYTSITPIVYAFRRSLLVSMLHSSNIVNTFRTSKSNPQFRPTAVSMFAPQYLITFSLCQSEPSHFLAPYLQYSFLHAQWNASGRVRSRECFKIGVQRQIALYFYFEICAVLF